MAPCPSLNVKVPSEKNYDKFFKTGLTFLNVVLKTAKLSCNVSPYRWDTLYKCNLNFNHAVPSLGIIVNNIEFAHAFGPDLEVFVYFSPTKLLYHSSVEPHLISLWYLVSFVIEGSPPLPYCLLMFCTLKVI